MRITTLGFTDTTPGFHALAQELGWSPTSTSPGEQLVEFAGRACYQSWHKPNPRTADTAAYIASILDKSHFSVIEHAQVVFYLQGVSRSLTHELIRHRHFSFSQLSQRFVDMSDTEPVVHPLLRGDQKAEDMLHTAFHYAVDAYEQLYDHLEATHPQLHHKELREAAREVLPNCTPTNIVVSGNLRSWLEFVHKRCSPAADAAIREVALAILDELQHLAPAVFCPEDEEMRHG